MFWLGRIGIKTSKYRTLISHAINRWKNEWFSFEIFIPLFSFTCLFRVTLSISLGMWNRDKNTQMNENKVVNIHTPNTEIFICIYFFFLFFFCYFRACNQFNISRLQSLCGSEMEWMVPSHQLWIFISSFHSFILFIRSLLLFSILVFIILIFGLIIIILFCLFSLVDMFNVKLNIETNPPLT